MRPEVTILVETAGTIQRIVFFVPYRSVPSSDDDKACHNRAVACKDESQSQSLSAKSYKTYIASAFFTTLGPLGGIKWNK